MPSKRLLIEYFTEVFAKTIHIFNVHKMSSLGHIDNTFTNLRYNKIKFIKRSTSMSTHETTPALEFKQVSFIADERHILHNINGTIQNGRITTLVGPSGAGKTTLLKLCNRLISPTNGQIKFNNEPIENITPTILRKQVGIVLQSAPVIRDTVRANIILPRKLHNEPVSDVEIRDMLNLVQLDEKLLTQPATKLSGGQKQKLAIARTLMNKPEVLLLDEITSALDPTSTREIEELILAINKKYGTTIIWITHNIDQAKAISNNVWVLAAGELIAAGDRSLLKLGKHPIIDDLLTGGIR